MASGTHEIHLKPAWAAAITVFILACLASWAVFQTSLNGLAIVVVWLLVWGQCIIACYTLIKPNKILILNDSYLEIRRSNGRLLAHVNRPKGVSLGQFVSIKVSPVRSYGFFAAQLKPGDFRRLSRWVRCG